MSCPTPSKHRHASHADAVAHLLSMVRVGRGEPTLRVYQCGDHWHIGNRGRGSLERQLRQAIILGEQRSRRRR